MTDPLQEARDIDGANRLIGMIVVALCAGLAGLIIGAWL